MKRSRTPVSTETLTTVASIVFGGWLLMPWATFVTSSVYSLMDQVAPEEVWGLAILGCGVWMLYAQLRGGVRMRTGAAVLAAFMWGVVAAVFCMGNPTGTGFPLVSLYAVFSAINVYRVVRGHE